MDSITNFIVKHLQSEYTIPDIVDLQTLNYIEQGYIDSIGIISFIVELEEQYSICFTDEEISSPDFRIVGSLAALIKSKMEK